MTKWKFFFVDFQFPIFRVWDLCGKFHTDSNLHWQIELRSQISANKGAHTLQIIRERKRDETRDFSCLNWAQSTPNHSRWHRKIWPRNIFAFFAITTDFSVIHIWIRFTLLGGDEPAPLSSASWITQTHTKFRAHYWQDSDDLSCRTSSLSKGFSCLSISLLNVFFFFLNWNL